MTALRAWGIRSRLGPGKCPPALDQTPTLLQSVIPEVVGRGLSRCDNPACVQRADRAAARFVPRLNGAGTPQRGVRYLL